MKEPIKPVKNFRIVTKKPYSLLVKKFEKVVVKMERENTNIVDGAWKTISLHKNLGQGYFHSHFTLIKTLNKSKAEGLFKANNKRKEISVVTYR